MRLTASQTILMGAGLGLAMVILAGCPKTPSLAPAPRAGATGPPVARPAPAPVPAPPVDQGTGYVATAALAQVHFDVGRAAIRSQDQAILDANARWLKANPASRILIEGYADERGTSAYNLDLAERRALATRDALVARGIAAARITVVAYGAQRPVCTERTFACWARNRRAGFLVKA
jgi:peptidoglycan-associated lipoprotein